MLCRALDPAAAGDSSHIAVMTAGRDGVSIRFENNWRVDSGMVTLGGF